MKTRFKKSVYNAEKVWRMVVETYGEIGEDLLDILFVFVTIIVTFTYPIWKPIHWFANYLIDENKQS